MGAIAHGECQCCGSKSPIELAARVMELEGVVSVLLDSYLSTDSFDGNKDALALEAERLVPDWKAQAEEWQPPETR